MMLGTILFCSLFLGSRAADTAAWKTRSIYFALTDRIAKDDSSGTDPCSDLSSYCGGTFKGLQSKLDYIQGMGFDAIWITPVVANDNGGYHGYWAKDLYSVNENYGSAEDLKNLVSAAHDKGMYVMVDVVANHMGPGDISNHAPEPLNTADAYHTPCEIDYSNQSSVENCEIADLPDVDTQDPDIRSLYQKWIGWLVDEYQFDGIRIDTVKHVEKEFWAPFTEASGVYSIGEVFDGDPSYVAGYADSMSGLLNYPIYYPLNAFYQQTGSSQDLVDMHNKISDMFPDPSALPLFIDNHDNPRWLSVKGDTSLLKNALAYCILGRGVPIVYYGTEQGFDGGNDPANREDLWRSGFDTDADLYNAISRLLKARSNAGGLGDDDHSHLYVEDTAYAWSRAGGDLIVFTTNSGSGSGGEFCFQTSRSNQDWTDTFGSGSYTSDGDGNVCVEVTNGEPVVLAAS